MRRRRADCICALKTVDDTRRQIVRQRDPDHRRHPLIQHRPEEERHADVAVEAEREPPFRDRTVQQAGESLARRFKQPRPPRLVELVVARCIRHQVRHGEVVAKL